jgi:copper(I)-binding protein
MHRILLLLATLLLSIPGRAADAPPLTIKEAWVRAVPPSLTDTAAFMRIQNTGDTPVRLTGGKTPIASVAMLMQTTHSTVQGVEALGMAALDFIDIPPHSECVLKPGGDHLMLMNLSFHPRPGDIVSVTLLFEPGHQTLTLPMPAQLDAAK